VSTNNSKLTPYSTLEDLLAADLRFDSDPSATLLESGTRLLYGTLLSV